MLGTVEYWYNDNNYVQSRSALNRAIGQYARHSRYIYIGLTQQRPEERFRQHQAKWASGHEWHRMIVIYRARSFNQMQKIEDDLIKYAEKKIEDGHYACQQINDRPSQRPQLALSPNGFWIYMLTQA